MAGISQVKLILSYYEQNPNRNIEHPEIVDWATAEWEKLTGQRFRDPDRAIRKLHQQGFLIKVRKGVYCYDPEAVKARDLEDFTLTQKRQILQRDGYRCVVCGLGKKDGVELQVDHIRPKDKGGEATIANGQTLCAKHNFQKKNYGQTETAKKMFIRLLDKAEGIGDERLSKFADAVLRVYKQHDINGHIPWRK